jgi:hypothetical protein
MICIKLKVKELKASWEARVHQLEAELERSEATMLQTTHRLESDLR